MTPWMLGRLLLALAALYCAVARQMNPVDERLDTPLVLAVAVIAFSGDRPARTVGCLAGTGLLLDLVSHHRLGLHLATVGMVSACIWSAAPRSRASCWWFQGLAAGLLAMADEGSSRLLSSLDHAVPWAFVPLLRDLLWMGLMASALVVTWHLLVGAVSRLAGWSVAASVPQLGNHWSMLTD